MWKYTHTDEMYHSLTNKNELFHSDTYLGQDFSDGIRHFKYIKRELVNGRWRYYYSHDEYNAAKANLKRAKTNYEVANTLARKADDRHTIANNRVVLSNLGKEVAGAFHKSEKNPLKRIKTKKTLKEQTKDYEEARKEYAKTSREKQAYEKNANDKYYQLADVEKKYNKIAKKTKVQRAVGNTAVKAANAVSDATYKTKKKVNKTITKGKNAVNKLFKTGKTYTGEKLSFDDAVKVKSTGKMKKVGSLKKKKKK